MKRSLLPAAVIALIFLLLGVAGAALAFAYLPDPGSPPSVYDDFAWSSVGNGYWHVNPVGASAEIKDNLLTLKGDTIELDRRVQTDPLETVVLAKVRGLSFHKFGLGIGVYHAGTVGLEFDNDGVKCGRGTDYGWKVDFLRAWKTPPVNQWFYVGISVRNPFPTEQALRKAEIIADKTNTKLKPITLRCYLFDAQKHLIAAEQPSNPPPNAHYVGFDEVFLRTWDSANDYQVDWLYAGPVSGIPQGITLPTRGIPHTPPITASTPSLSAPTPPPTH